jgi:hypothetical protein
VINEIDTGNLSTFTVSRDYFNNGFDYKCLPSEDLIEIREANAGRFRIVASYDQFRKSVIAFFNSAMFDLGMFYPELQKNEVFTRYTKIYA